ncbi:MAG: hypothetical protein HY791_12525 [Deltaproteobacteria bacterium]|nr:hypothetical protein [Deltaproteobacteria bacterium]
MDRPPGKGPAPGAPSPEVSELLELLARPKSPEQDNLSRKLGALDAGAIPDVYSPEGNTDDLDAMLAGLIETAEYEQESALSSLGALISTSGTNAPRDRQVSSLIECLVEELSERKSAPPRPSTSGTDWPDAEIVLEPTPSADIIIEDPVEAPPQLADPQSADPRSADSRSEKRVHRYLSVEIDIDEVAPDLYDPTVGSRELRELCAIAEIWQSRTPAEILGWDGQNSAELRANFNHLRGQYEPTAADAPDVRAKKRELLGLLFRAAAALDGAPNALPSFLNPSMTETPAPYRTANSAIGRQLLATAKSMIKSGQHDLAEQSLETLRQNAPGLAPIARVWSSYLRTLVDRSPRAAELAVAELIAELNHATLGPDEAESLLLLGRLFRRLDRNYEALEAFKRACSIDPGDGEAREELQSLNLKKSAIAALRLSGRSDGK